jgi:N-acetyl-alpha-D-glucosaminyl L-malate synthase BshA
MHEVVRSHRLDLLHVHYAIPHATSAWIAREMLEQTGSGIRIITTLHGTDITIVGQDPSFHAITKFSIEKSDRLTAVSHYLREETVRAFGCAGCDVQVIHNFIDGEVYKRSKYPATIREQLNGNRRILMHISNFRPVKRVRDVIRIFARVVESVPSVLVMVGDGPDRLEAENEARALGIDSSVFFLGRLDSVAPLLAGADLFLLPSQNESFGLSALEALASGVPVIAADSGGIVEVVRQGETGILCPVGDVDAMAAGAVKILEDGDRWAAMSAAAAADARARFGLDEIVGQYEALYRDALA